MRVTRLYYSQTVTAGQQIELAKADSHRLLNVLRLKIDAPLQIFDGLGHEHAAKVVKVQKKQAVVEIGQPITQANESPLAIHLGQALLRSEKMDWVLQKSVELGVNAITPLITDFVNVNLINERMEKRLQHWQQVVIQACEQSGRSVLPTLNLPVSLAQWIEKVIADCKIIWQPQSAQSLADLTIKPATVAMLIGPEGGLNQEEVELAQKQGFKPLKLGKRILRTETMSLAAIAALQLKWGDFR